MQSEAAPWTLRRVGAGAETEASSPQLLGARGGTLALAGEKRSMALKGTVIWGDDTS